MKTILVLEDDPIVAVLLRRTLKHSVLLEAATAEQALQLFNNNARQIDLLVADVTLATSSGIQVALILRSDIPDLPVILASGYPVGYWNDRDSADLQRLGWRSLTILQKPFQAKMLSNAVVELTGSAQADKAKTA
jgi:CheY-like chemotaxis protein